MKTPPILGTALVLALVACGGGDDGAESSPGTAANAQEVGDATGTDDVDDSGGGTTGVTNVQPPGQATASVDGKDFTLTEKGALDCDVTDDAVTFSFRIGDNEITLGGGANRTDDDWLGGFDLRVANPDGEPGPIAYFAELPANSAGMTVSGDSFSYSGPMLKQLANDGSNPPPVDAGDGVVSLTCP